MEALGKALIEIAMLEDDPVPQRLPGVTVNVPPVAVTSKMSVFTGSVVVPESVVFVPV